MTLKEQTIKRIENQKEKDSQTNQNKIRSLLKIIY